MKLKMKSWSEHEKAKKVPAASVCKGAFGIVLARIAQGKDAILADWPETPTTHQNLVRLALNEAEAVAWQTAYPHLVFPELASEKVQAVAAWNRRQQRFWSNNLTVHQ